MPDFVPQYTPRAPIDDFALGYLIAAEWLLDEEDAARPIRGWSRAAIRRAVKTCAHFQRNNAAALADYCATYRPSGGYSPLECAGHDFWLTRNGHGAGFRDRGTEPCFQQLADAARRYGECDAYRGDTAWLHLG